MTRRRSRTRARSGTGPARAPSRGSPADRSRPWMVPALVALAGIILRAVVLLRTIEPPETWGGDPKTYLEILDGLLAGRPTPEMWIWPPGYPVLAIPLRPLLGSGAALQAISFITGAATPVILLLAGRRPGLRLTATIAAWIVAFHPEAVYASALPLSGAPALFLSVLAALALETTIRTRSRRWAVTAGAAGGLAILCRPEIALSVLLYGVIGWLVSREARRRIIGYGLITLLIVAPYVVGLHHVSGAWALTLKSQFNFLKQSVYRGRSDFVEARVVWDEYAERFEDENGELDPRKLAQGFDTRRFFTSREPYAAWPRNVRLAFHRNPLLINLFWIAGLVGLLLGGRDGRRARVLALASAAPLAAIPVMYTPIARYSLIAVPGFAWGVGSGIAELHRRWGLLRRRPAAAGVLALGLLVGTAGIVGAMRRSRDAHWIGRRSSSR